MLAFIIFAALTITIFLSVIAVFADETKHDHVNKDTLEDLLKNK